jgi:cbb3-type cytochrome oxidase maturation protein
MEILIVMIPVTVIVAFLLIALFNWAVENGQYEDLERAGNDALFHEDDPETLTRPERKEE